jgi:hypothetical protein
MADLSVTAASVLASNSADIKYNYKFGATVTTGQAVYLDAATNTWKLIDQDAAATGNGVSNIRGIALNNGANNQPAAVCIRDIAFTPGTTLTNGTAVYASDNAGAITHDVPGAGSYTTFLGLPISTTQMNLLPVAGGVAV